jgi:hypothetical protein
MRPPVTKAKVEDVVIGSITVAACRSWIKSTISMKRDDMHKLTMRAIEEGKLTLTEDEKETLAKMEA